MKRRSLLRLGSGLLLVAVTWPAAPAAGQEVSLLARLAAVAIRKGGVSEIAKDTSLRLSVVAAMQEETRTSAGARIEAEQILSREAELRAKRTGISKAAAYALAMHDHPCAAAAAVAALGDVTRARRELVEELLAKELAPIVELVTGEDVDLRVERSLPAFSQAAEALRKAARDCPPVETLVREHESRSATLADLADRLAATMHSSDYEHDALELLDAATGRRS